MDYRGENRCRPKCTGSWGALYLKFCGKACQGTKFCFSALTHASMNDKTCGLLRGACAERVKRVEGLALI